MSKSKSGHSHWQTVKDRVYIIDSGTEEAARLSVTQAEQLFRDLPALIKDAKAAEVEEMRTRLKALLTQRELVDKQIAATEQAIQGATTCESSSPPPPAKGEPPSPT